MSNLPLAQFAQRLLIDGHAAVVPFDMLMRTSDKDQHQTSLILRDAESLLRSAAPAVPPTLDLSAAIWALRVFGWAGYTILDRNQERTELPSALSQSCPDSARVESHWSVDVVFRFWPDVCNRAQRIAAQDTLHATLARIISKWPLSAVGLPMESSSDAELECVLSDNSLRRMLVDRVASRGDLRLAANAAIQAVLNQDAGAYAELLKLDSLLLDETQS